MDLDLNLVFVLTIKAMVYLLDLKSGTLADFTFILYIPYIFLHLLYYLP